MKMLLILISLLGMNAYADQSSTLPGNFSLVSGLKCPDSQEIYLDLKGKRIQVWGTEFTSQQQCSKDQSQLNTPEECRQASFSQYHMVTKTIQNEYVFGLFQGSTYTETMTFDFSQDYRTVVITTRGKDSNHYPCTYQYNK